jgi:hypothetical protein
MYINKCTDANLHCRVQPTLQGRKWLHVISTTHHNHCNIVHYLRGVEVVGGWRRLHSKELRNLYASPNIIKAIKLRRVKWGACRTHGRDEK